MDDRRRVNKLNFRMKCFCLCDPIAAILLYATGRLTVEADLTLDLAPSRIGCIVARALTSQPCDFEAISFARSAAIDCMAGSSSTLAAFRIAFEIRKGRT